MLLVYTQQGRQIFSRGDIHIIIISNQNQFVNFDSGHWITQSGLPEGTPQIRCLENFKRKKNHSVTKFIN